MHMLWGKTLTQSRGVLRPRNLANVCASALAFSGTALAADQSSVITQQGEEIQTVIVTARKTGAESLQSVPLAITAIQIDKMNAAQITNIVDVGRLAPNVQLQTAASFPAFANFTIRGMSVNNSLRSLDPTVVVVTDGMSFGDPYGTLVDTFDLESVEILRGPQGILFGRNATGGAVVLRSRLPGTDTRLETSMRVGNLGRFDQSLVAETPVAGPALRAKVALLHRESDGQSKDRNGGSFVAAPGNPSGAQPANATGIQSGENLLLVRPSVIWEPTEGFSASLIYEYIDAKYGGNNSRVLATRPALLDILGFIPPTKSYEINHDEMGSSRLESNRVALEANWDTSAGVFTSVSGYRKIDMTSSMELDGTPFLLQNWPDNEFGSEQFSQEFRFASNVSDDIKILAGVSYSELRMTTLEKRLRNRLVASLLPPYDILQWLQGDWVQKSDNKSLFANVDWTIVPGLTVSGGARYTEEHKSMDTVPIALCGGADFAGCPTTRYFREHDWNDVSPRVAVSYQANPDMLVYTSWTRGFRSGNFNGRASSPLGIGPSEPETATAIELGFKGTFFSRRASLNAALYQTKYSDVQKVLTNAQAIQAILNAANATIRGIELEATILPFRGFTIDASFGLTDAQYDDFQGLDVNGDGVPDPSLAKDLKFERVPKYTASLAATYEFNLFSMPGDWTARTSYSWSSKMFTDLVNRPQTTVPSIGLVDMSVAYAPTSNFKASVYARNLTDEDYFDASITTNWGYLGFGGSPRTYGLEMTLSF